MCHRVGEGLLVRSVDTQQKIRGYTRQNKKVAYPHGETTSNGMKKKYAVVAVSYLISKGLCCNCWSAMICSM